MTSSNGTENVIQFKTCRCGADDASFWTKNDNSEKQIDKCPVCEVLKSGTLLISSKGLGWTSWKKRWFILTRKSLVFFRSDPATLPQKGSEANLILGHIDLNNSGSVEVKVEKKLLRVLFPGGRDGRTFTLKAETSEELYGWKAALENALLQASSPADAVGQNGFRIDAVHSIKSSSSEQVRREEIPLRSTEVRRPILLALEDIDGSPSLLEKALRFIEQHGIKVEGILRQSADVEEVKQRVQEYEQGKVEFSPDEDAHVVGDCIKHVLRELPSSPVPASCCTILVQAYRTDCGNRVEATRDAIYEHFPEPNRHLLQRILKMMQTIASHKSQNRMTLSALAACMAPLLLRPLLAGECDFDDNFSMGGDGSMQLRLAAAAANYAQAIVIVLLEEYDYIFNDDLMHDDSYSEPYSGNEDGDIEDYGPTDKDIPEPDGYREVHNDHGADIHDDPDNISSDTLSENSDAVRDPYYDKVKDYPDIKTSSTVDKNIGTSKSFSGPIGNPLLQDDADNSSSLTYVTSFSNDASTWEKETQCESSNLIALPLGDSYESIMDFPSLTSQRLKSDRENSTSTTAIFPNKGHRHLQLNKRRTILGRTSGRKNLSMEFIDVSSEDEVAVQRLESTKADLQMKIAKEVEGNAVLQASLEKEKEALRERRLALEQDVERLCGQLQKERDLRASLESGLMNIGPGHISLTSSMDIKAKKDLEEVALAEGDIVALKQKVADLRGQLNLQLQQSYITLCESCNERLYSKDEYSMKHQPEDVSSKTLSEQSRRFSTIPDSPGSPHKTLVEKEPELTSPEDTKPQPNRIAASAFEYDSIITSGASCSSTEHSSASKYLSKKEFKKGVKLQGLVLPLLSSKKHQASLQSNMILPTVSSPPYLEPTIVKSNSISNSFPSGNQNHVLAANSSNMESYSQGSVSPSAVQPSQKQKTSMLNKRSHGKVPSNEDPKAVGRATALKKFSLWGENLKKETQDLVSLPIKQLSEKKPNTSVGTSKFQRTDNVSSSKEPGMVGHNGALRKLHCNSEEAISSTSALTKLTKRLNFLKERRSQLVNEIQNSETERTSGLNGPSRTNSI